MKPNNDLTKEIERLSRIVERMTTPIPAIPAIPANGDHDLLVRLDTKMIELKIAVDKLTERDSDFITVRTFEAHLLKEQSLEERTRTNEISITRIMSYGTALIFAVGISEFIIGKVWK